MNLIRQYNMIKGKQMSGKGYIACAHFEETIHHFGEGSTPEEALKDFLGAEFEEYCNYYELEDNTYVDVKVFEAIYANTPEANMEDFEDGWNFILGDEVSSHTHLFLIEE